MSDNKNTLPDYCDAEVRIKLQKMRTGYYEIPAYRKHWTPEEIEFLIDKAGAGYGISYIAVTLGHSENSVIAKMRSLELFKPVYKSCKERKANERMEDNA